MNRIFSSWCSSSVSVNTCIQLMVRPFVASLLPTAGTLFSALQAITQDWQPVQRSKSMTMPHSATLCPPESHLGCIEHAESPQRIRFVGDQVVGIGSFAAEERNMDHLRPRA